MGAESRGAYGFRLVLRACEHELPDLSPLEDDAPEVALECRHATGLVERNRVEDGLVCLGEKGRSLLEAKRDPLSITLEFPDPVTPEALVHPLLTPPISILCRWRGDLTLHAGGFYADDRAWGVMGAREAGKSTTLANMAAAGHPLLADDLLVLDEGVVRAGPACIDLRPDVAERMDGARSLGKVGDRVRYRLSTPPGPPRAELGGFFLLDWAQDDRVEIEALPPTEALKVVYDQEYIGLIGPADPNKIFDLLETPMWRVRRPREWDATEETLAAMLEVTAG